MVSNVGRPVPLLHERRLDAAKADVLHEHRQHGVHSCCGRSEDGLDAKRVRTSIQLLTRSPVRRDEGFRRDGNDLANLGVGEIKDPLSAAPYAPSAPLRLSSGCSNSARASAPR